MDGRPLPRKALSATMPCSASVLLIDMLGRLGVQVRLVVKPTRRRQVA
jgi:hypothetical protein